MGAASSPEVARRAALSIVQTLREAGHVAYFAGGCVRDELLGRHPTDYDVATDATPAVVRKLFKSTAEVGASFGVVLVHLRPEPRERATVEVATFRSDGPYSDRRRPDAVRFSDEVSDAHRRDFTINALFLDPLAPAAERTPGAQGRVVDHVGGMIDLRAGVIRAVGDPDQRLAEDHLRALRAVRFAARYGFTIEPATADAVRRHARELQGVSRERIGEELRRMLSDPRGRAEAVGLLGRLRLDEPILGGPSSAPGAATLAALPEAAAFSEALAAWALDRGHDPAASPDGTPIRARRTRSKAQLPATGEPGGVEEGGWAGEASGGAGRRGGWRAALCLSNDETEAAEGVLLALGRLIREWDSLPVAGQKRLAGGNPWFPAAMRLLRAWETTRSSEQVPVGERTISRADAIERRMAELAASPSGLWPPPVLTGDDLIAAGFCSGPAFKRILDAVYDAQLEGLLKTRDQGLELARRLSV